MRNKKNPEIAVSAVVCFGLMLVVLWIYYGAVFGEKPVENKKEFSVVLYHNGNDGWESLVEGMKQAEDDFGVNINYITTKEGMTGEEQLELVRQEITGGTDGILLAALDSGMMFQNIQGEGTQVPVITIESDADGAGYQFISADNKAMGQILGQALLGDFSDEEKIRIAVIEEYTERSSVSERLKGFYEAVGDSVEIMVLKREDSRVDMAAYMETWLKYTEADAIAAFSKEPLEVLCGMNPEALRGAKLYGIGNTASIVAALDKGKIERLVFQNEFNIGYLSVEAMLKKIEGIQEERKEIDIYCVGKENVHETQYERLLFPIVE